MIHYHYKKKLKKSRNENHSISQIIPSDHLKASLLGVGKVCKIQIQNKNLFMLTKHLK